ncbi:hypothetical protein HPB48_013675 [Haemaphysalis longicornis]|uniref:Uncharacterized protein n=1 Tax=Haemaphysalis longicornis TaxID=44386 RepID=A0A9J6GS34_HAELO|nr:hypothetical protein HPB48_013675 [Haemaphysalis longicornis]
MIMRQDSEPSNFKSVESAHGGSQSFPKLIRKHKRQHSANRPHGLPQLCSSLPSMCTCSSIRTSWPVSVVWVTLSTLVAIMSLVSLVQPEWLVRERTDTPRPPLTYDPDDLEYMLGLYGACYRDAQENGPVLVPGDALCYRFREDDASPFQREEASAGEGVDPRFPSRTWHASFLLFSFGSAVLCIGAVLAILSLAMEGTSNRKAAAAVIGHAQGAGGKDTPSYLQKRECST